MAFEGEFIGFTFNGHHSSEFGILHVSDGSRYSDSLLPSFSNKAILVPGADRSLYYGMDYGSRNLVLNIAFDSVTESQFRALRQWLGNKKLGELYFDESPYKVYTAKVDTPPNITFLCFDEMVNGISQRVYKGEGSINFICYEAFAKSRFKYSDDIPSEYVNKHEWLAASGITTKGDKDIFNQNVAHIANRGDVDTSFQLYIKGTVIPKCEFCLATSESGTAIPPYQLATNEILTKGSDAGIIINSKTQLIEGIDAMNNKTGNIYNDFILGGYLFKVPVGDWFFKVTPSGTGTINDSALQIKYDYLYY